MMQFAPRAGLEPATLRLTGGKGVVSRLLPQCADAAGSALVAPRIERFAGFALCRPLLPFAAPCCSERARIGQRLRKASLRRRRSRIGEGHAVCRCCAPHWTAGRDCEHGHEAPSSKVTLPTPNGSSRRAVIRSYGRSISSCWTYTSSRERRRPCGSWNAAVPKLTTTRIGK